MSPPPADHRLAVPAAASTASWTQAGRRVRVPTTGMTLDYAEAGDRADPTVLLIMGMSGQRILWPRELVGALVGGGCHVVAHDNRDVGRSTVLDDLPVGLVTVAAAMNGHPVTAPYGLSDMALDAVGLLDHLEVERAHVVGVSMGGMIAQHLAIDHPGRVATLTSINSTHGMTPPAEPLAEPVEVPDPTPPTERAAFIDWFVTGLRELSSPRFFDEAETRELAGAVHARGVHPQGNLRHLLAMLADGDRTARLGRVVAPTLVVHGAEDPLVDAAEGRATARAVPDARLLVLDGMGHELALPLVPELAEALLALVDRVSARAGR